ncbi:MAG: hypothetical protein WA125_18310, partial [Desulfosporosinus sp.]
SFARYYYEMSSMGENMDDRHMDAILEIVLLKHGTNIELPDDLLEIVTTLKEMGPLDPILKQFPESEVQRAFEQIKLDFEKVENQFQEFMDEE